MENEDEISSGHKNTQYRKLDTRIGRWLSVDPAAELYYSWSPYNLSMNNPLANTDPSGATVTPPKSGTTEDADLNVALQNPKFKAQHDVLQASENLYDYKNVTTGDSKIVVTGRNNDGTYNFNMHSGGASMGQNDDGSYQLQIQYNKATLDNFFGRPELHSLFEETFHSADLERKTLGHLVISDRKGGFELGVGFNGRGLLSLYNSTHLGGGSNSEWKRGKSAIQQIVKQNTNIASIKAEVDAKLFAYMYSGTPRNTINLSNKTVTAWANNGITLLTTSTSIQIQNSLATQIQNIGVATEVARMKSRALIEDAMYHKETPVNFKFNDSRGRGRTGSTILSPPYYKFIR